MTTRRLPPYLGLWYYDLLNPSFEDIETVLLPRLEESFDTKLWAGKASDVLIGYTVCDVYFYLYEHNSKKCITLPFVNCINNDWYTVKAFDNGTKSQFDFELEAALQYNVFEHSGGTLLEQDCVELDDSGNAKLFDQYEAKISIIKILLRLTSYPTDAFSQYSSPKDVEIHTQHVKDRAAHFKTLKQWIKDRKNNKELD